MVSVKEISALYKACVEAKQILDNIYNASLVLEANMQGKQNQIDEEVVYSTSLVADATTKVISLETEVIALVSGLPMTAEALSAVQIQLEIAKKNLKLMEQRLSLAYELQVDFSTFRENTMDKLNIYMKQFSEKVDLLNTRINHATNALENYFNINSVQGSIDFIKQKSQYFEYQKLLYNIGKASMQDVENAYKEKLNAKKDSFITSKKASELGIKISEYNMPEFESRFDTNITLDHFDKERYVHDRMANKALKEAIVDNNELKKRFNSRQLQQIESGITPDGYTWHHDGNPPPGRIQLVDSDIHNSVRHTGGYSLWCERI